ncbi:MAG: hypothetical protein KJ620_06470 [Candidatus Edwardsbacteria bacterium]|nr:hypothetical protein [Candidatus Edwardsbacteria bacterium]MBU1576726.1 hypothetical protein [Candidatus Edwardsbacteria bacterium]MBU2464510.1 hypothetical protein [Candidatus Edwardsbacteria bacterium]MBU2594807.1 hypothetical protein [Candidatus Edwardsbacteria bacterium]
METGFHHIVVNDTRKNKKAQGENHLAQLTIPRLCPDKMEPQTKAFDSSFSFLSRQNEKEPKRKKLVAEPLLVSPKASA